jgi:hypothetical protein
MRGWHRLCGTGVYDGLTLASVLFMLFLVALTAAILPTLRIARIDPAMHCATNRKT